jgi:hypothetical protein
MNKEEKLIEEVAKMIWLDIKDVSCSNQIAYEKAKQIIDLVRGSEWVSVPASELNDLEKVRVSIYEYLGDKLTEDQLSNEFPHLTKQIWRVANTKKW